MFKENPESFIDACPDTTSICVWHYTVRNLGGCVARTTKHGSHCSDRTCCQLSPLYGNTIHYGLMKS
jgi:hypothetical protein